LSATKIPIRWRDLDALGHVNAVVFLTYLEEGRNVWLREVLGEQFGPEQWVLARVEIDFRAEIPLQIGYVQTTHEIESLGRSSVTLTERLIDNDATTLADARVVLAMWDPEERRSRPITEAEREAFSPLTVTR
jgi:acyl-CoA thioester hydrolase